MPTAKSGRPDRSAGSGRPRKTVDGVAGSTDSSGSAEAEDVLDDGAVDASGDSLADDLLNGADDDLADDSDDGADDDDPDDDGSDDDGSDDDDLDDDSDDDDADSDDDDERSSGSTLTKTRTRSGSTKTSLDKKLDKKSGTKSGSGGSSRPAKSRRPRDQRTGNPFVAMIRFVREVVGEMRKVLWPTRRELIIYTIAVIIFVTVMISIVGGLDFGFARLVLLVFG